MQGTDPTCDACVDPSTLRLRVMTNGRDDAAVELAGAIEALKQATLRRHRAVPGTKAYEDALMLEEEIDGRVLDLARRPEPPTAHDG